MSTKEDLSASVPILVGPNWIIWEAQMKAYLRMKGLWQLVQGNEPRPLPLPTGRQARPAVAATADAPALEAVTAIPFPTDTELSARLKEQQEWDNRDDQALGIITLKISHSLRTHIGDDSHIAWQNLVTAFATPGPAAIFNDFAKVVNLRIQPNRHPAADMNNMWDLFERLHAQQVDIPPTLRALILLNAIPTSLQSVVSVQLQTNATADLNFDDILCTIYEQTARGNNPNTHKLSAVKRKGADPHYNQQRNKKFQSSDQPDRPQQGSSKDGEQVPKKNKNRNRGSGSVRGRGRGRGGAKGGNLHEHHDHSHIGSSLLTPSKPLVNKGYESNFPPLPLQPMIALQPSRATLQSTTVASFSKDKVSYRTVPINQPVVLGKRTSAFPESQRTLDAFKDVDMPMTVQNFKNVDKAVNKKGKGKEVMQSPEQTLASTSSAPLVACISSPADEPLIWCTDEEMFDAGPPKTVEEATIIEEDLYNFDESDDSEGCPRQVGTYGWGDTLDDDIAEAAGFDSGYINKRQVTSLSSPNTFSLTTKSAFLAGNITEQDLHSICNSLNKYSVHASSCEKCKGH